MTTLESPSNWTYDRLWRANRFKARSALLISSWSGKDGGNKDVWAKRTSPRSFLPTATTIERWGVIATSKLILTQPKGGGIHLVANGDLSTI